ncbi:MAG: hypothetical protein GAK40_01272 [Burkholderia plantarii]|nr:MAG: hypothetical protein GAK40_01272 [Burkholderia plantarii]
MLRRFPGGVAIGLPARAPGRLQSAAGATRLHFTLWSRTPPDSGAAGPLMARVTVVRDGTPSLRFAFAFTPAPMIPTLDANALRELAERAEAHPDTPCDCRKTSLDGWQSQPLSLDESRLTQIGTLRGDPDAEPSYQEYLPNGLGYGSPDAPIAPRHFPYNQCDVWACADCGRLLLRYVEGGGYFVDRRVRAVRSALIVDAAL